MTTLEKTILMRCLSWKAAIVNGIVFSAIVLTWTDSAVAQRRPIADDTLGNERSRVIPLDPQGDRIEGGAQRGGNLFHSFQEFQVDEGRSVYFADPGVENILSRVTGDNASQILGVLGVLGDANLFLLNPNGIVFGRNARLDMRGSFLATTANAVRFGEQGFFSATDPMAPPLLTVQPTAFLFSQLTPALIANNSQTPAASNPSGIPEFGLRVPAGESLTLLGGNVSLDGGGLVAPGGRVEVGGLSEPGTVALNADGSLGFPTGVARSNVSLLNGSRLNAVADGGSITVNAGALEILDSILSAGIGRNSGFMGAQGGDITLNASAIRIQGATAGVANSVRSGGTGNAGDIRITTGSLSIITGSLSGDRIEISTSTSGQGDAGNVIINAGDLVVLDGSRILSNVGSSNSNVVAVGEGGNIQITTPSLSLINGTQLQSITYGRGNGGDVIINAPDRVFLDGSNIFSTVDRSTNTTGIGNGGDTRITTGSLSLTNGARLNANMAGQGNAGDIRITTNSLALSNNARFDASLLGRGNGGNVIINARDRVDIDSSVIFNIVVGDNVNGFGVGNSGDIHITTGSLSLTNGGQLQTLTRAQGNAGNVMINARDRVSLDGSNPIRPRFNSGIYSSVGDSNSAAVAVGSGGDIRITTGSLSLTNGAELSASTFGRGDAGNVMINARDRVSLDGSNPASPRDSSAISSTVGDENSAAAAVGNGGDIRITTGSLFLTNGGQLAATVFGQGNAGNVIVRARDRVSLSGGNAISPEVRSAILSNVNELGMGDGGDIRVTAGSFFLNNFAQVNTSTIGQGDAGNILLRAPTGSLVVTNGSQISAGTTGQGDAGDIVINVRDRVSLSGANSSNPASSSAIFSSVATTDSGQIGRGNGGNIRITAGSLSLTEGTQLVASTNGRGDAGNIFINARNQVSFDGENSEGFPSGIISDVANTFVVGDGGDIRITAGSLSLTNGARLNSSTSGQGNAGNISITARGRVSVEGVNRREFASAITSSTEAGAQGRGGNISIRADSVRLADRGSIFSSTRNRLPGGTVTVTANTFEAIGGSQVNTSSNNQGRAGNIILNAADRVTLSGVTNNRPSSLQGNASGLYASTARSATAPSGNVQITTEQLQVFDRARIAVDSRGSGVGGNISITAADVQLNDQARLTAETVADDGGNITLRDVGILRLGSNSLISTTAGTDRAGGNGGNIDIDGNFIVALDNDNSDITANAFSGSGGNVDITTEGLFGIAAQAQNNPLTNDITASSQRGVQGTVSITTPDIDPTRGLTELPAEVVDASSQITQTCGARAGTSEFVVTGRGGVPSSPVGPLVGDDSLAEWSTLDEPEGATAPPSRESDGTPAGATRLWRQREAIVEAQGWVMGEDGTMQLIAAASASPVRSPEVCQQPDASIIQSN
jgi:filamentous hemagglutinin family protein